MRVSRVGDRAERLISPELQEARIAGYARAHGVEVEVLSPELDESGGDAARPVLDAIKEGIAAGRYGGVIVAQLDRLSRMDLADAMRTIQEIEEMGGQVISVAENFDAETPEGEMARNVLLSLGNMQLKRYRAQFNAAKRSAVERGIWPFPKAPVGYLVHHRKDRGDGHLRPDPDRRGDALRAFELRAAGTAWTQIADMLGMSVSAVQKMIRNRAYLGELRLRIDGEEIVNPNAHEAIVSVELWHAAQGSRPRPPRGQSGPALLGGLVRCAGCGRTMTADNGWNGKTAMYRCHPRNATGRCEAPALVAKKLIEPYVEAAALELLHGLSFRASADSRLAAALEAMRDAEAELEAFQQATSAAGNPELFTVGLRQRVEDVQRARADVAAARQPVLAGLPAGDVDSLWGELTVGERRHVLRGVLGVVWVRKGRGDLAARVRVIARGHEPSDLSRPGGGRIRPVEPVAWPTDDLPGEIRPTNPQHVQQRRGTAAQGEGERFSLATIPRRTADALTSA
jgi:DNA invertase Pin-like site-specific DNA recombinase